MEDSQPTCNSVVNVEKVDLLDKAVEKEEANKVSDSVVNGGNGADVGERSPETTKVELPEDLAKSVVILTCDSVGNNGSCDVYLIGTVHGSNESCRQVQALISILKPEVVFLELCVGRVSNLGPHTTVKSPTPTPTMLDMIKSWKQKENFFAILMDLIPAEDPSTPEVPYANEFCVAYEEALKYGGVVILGDRHIQITYKRTWAKMPLLLKLKCISLTLYAAFFLRGVHIEDEDETDISDLISEASKDYPSVIDTFVHERDQYMSCALLSVASKQRSVVAVVGKAHVNGIKKNWKQPISVKDLTEIPEPVFTVKRVVSSAAIAFAGRAIIRLARRR